MVIKKVQGREVYDSRGWPTVECVITLENDAQVSASVPSGVSCSSFEAVELRDGGQRLFGKGVLKAIDHIENIIGPALVGKVPNLIEMDLQIIDLDGTANKSKLGANATLAASIAVARAQSHDEGMKLYELIAYLSGSETVTMPYPLFNIINGGAHAHNGLRIQEFMIMPAGGQHYREALEQAVVLYHTLQDILIEYDRTIFVGDEGGFASFFENELEALDFIMNAIEKVGGEDVFRIALDVAASQFYDQKKKIYDWNGKKFTTEEMVGLYNYLTEEYPIYSIEDGLSEHDWDGWKRLMEDLGDSVQIVGDDLFATNTHRIAKGIEDGVANAVIIKPNQIGTVTQTLQALQLAQQHEWSTIVSHRSGDTCDTFIADLAVGTSSGQIKAGGCSRGERMAKYNRLLNIEDELVFTLLDV